MVEKIPAMISMARVDKGAKDAPEMPDPPLYPYGLCISLCDDELAKLGIEEDDLGIGDILHLHCLASVTSVSSNATESGSNCRVELQITNIAAESEDDENEDQEAAEDGKSKRLSKLYL